MVQKLPLNERLQTAGQLVGRARIFYDIWWYYEGSETRPQIIETMNQYSEFFRFEPHAHFVAFVVHIAGLFENRDDTINLPALFREAKEANVISGTRVAECEAFFCQLKEIIPKAIILRSNLFGHRSAKLSYAAAFEKAGVTPNSLRGLCDTGLMIANTMLKSAGLQEQHFTDLPLRDVQAVIKALSAPQSK